MAIPGKFKKESYGWLFRFNDKDDLVVKLRSLVDDPDLIVKQGWIYRLQIRSVRLLKSISHYTILLTILKNKYPEDIISYYS
jgi:hypothetical protein